MRDFLTGIAIVLIIVLTTVLVAPYFVDWTSQRGFLEARLSHALGQKVTIGGNIDLKLLPTPYLVLDQVVVGGDDGPVQVGIHHLDLELTVAPLLHGEFDIVEARLEEPTIRVTLEHDRTLPALPTAPAFQADVRFDRIQVSDGTLAIADTETGRTFVLDHIDLDADAGSFTGPFKVNGSEGPSDRRTKFHLATTAAQNGRTHARLAVEETPDHAGLELDGAVDFAAAGPHAFRQSFDGTLLVSGHADDAPIGWKISGPVKADPKQAVLDGGELRLGSEDAGVTLTANATAQLDDRPKLVLDLSAKQLDIDRLSGAPVDAVKPPPPKLPDIAAVRRLLAAIQPVIPTEIDVAVDNATYGGETLSDLQAHVGLGDTAGHRLKLAGDGPGGSHVSLDGTLGGPDATTFTGAFDLDADNLPRAVDWLASVAPSLPWKGSDLAFKTVKIAGRLEASPTLLKGDHLAVTLDRSVLSGDASLTFADSTRAAKITAVLNAEALDLDGLPSLDTLRGGSSPIDLDLHLDAKAIKVSRLGDGALDSGHLQIAVAKTGSHLALQTFRADNLGGASLQASGSLDPDRGKLALTLDAARLDAAAALVRQLAPGPVSDALVARAAALAPAKLSIDAKLSPGNGGGLTPSVLEIKGQLGATRVDATAKPDTQTPDVTAISATLDAPDGGPLLAVFGVPALPMNVIGTSRVALAAKGHKGEPFDTTLSATFGATRLAVSGQFDILTPRPRGSGTLHLQSPDLTPLLQSLAIAFPDMTGRVGADITAALALDDKGASFENLQGRASGVALHGAVHYRQASHDQPTLTGALDVDRLSMASLFGLALGPPQSAGADAIWSQAPLAVGLIDPPHAAFTLKAKTLEVLPGLEAANASLDLGVAPNVVTFDNLSADLSGGRVDATATLRRDGRQATVEGRLALDHVGVQIAALGTRLTAKLDIAGGGASSLGLIGSLAGSGEATAAGLRIPNGDPSALPRVFEDVENDALAFDQDAVIRAFNDAAKAQLSAGTRHFGLSLAAGVLHFDPKDPEPFSDGTVSTKIDGAFDLTRNHADVDLEQTLDALPKNWNGPPPSIAVKIGGPVGAPTRTIDVSGFLNAVAARALARETARIEAYEFDIRERAIFNARLQSEQRREEERQKAEDDARKAEARAEAEARKAEADRKARLEAARLERLRKEQAAKAAREEAERAARERENANPPQDRSPPAADQGASPPQPDPRPAPQTPPSATDPSALGRY